MKSTEMARAVLTADAIGCGLGALAALVAPRTIWHWLGLPVSWRFRATGALAMTTTVLASGAKEEVPSREHLTRAALGNAAWVAVLAVLCMKCGRVWQTPGRVLMVAIMVNDAAMGALQWWLRDSPLENSND